MLGKNLVYIDSMELMSSGLERLFQNLSKDKFKYSSQDFCGK